MFVYIYIYICTSARLRGPSLLQCTYTTVPFQEILTASLPNIPGRSAGYTHYVCYKELTLQWTSSGFVQIYIQSKYVYGGGEKREASFFWFCLRTTNSRHGYEQEPGSWKKKKVGLLHTAGKLKSIDRPEWDIKEGISLPAERAKRGRHVERQSSGHCSYKISYSFLPWHRHP